MTGGGGSIGAELCRQLSRLGIARLTVYERSEFNLYEIERELRESAPSVALQFVLGDVCDPVAVDTAFAKHKPEIVFHAAAYKHVPILETQAREAVRNNVLGTNNIIQAAETHRCEIFVQISTDKAVEPKSVMGMTKRFAEYLCEMRGVESSCRFVTVRFGNVLGSAGSVVPLFQQQIRQGGPITVTHPDATRYFMTIPEATQLIMLAAAVGRGGEIFVLNMGTPVNITYLAEQMIRLSGHVPNEDIDIVYTGLRPGEKLTEELFHQKEGLEPTAHRQLLLARHTNLERRRIEQLLERLLSAIDNQDESEVKRTLGEAIQAALSEAQSAVKLIDFPKQT